MFESSQPVQDFGKSSVSKLVVRELLGIYSSLFVAWLRKVVCCRNSKQHGKQRRLCEVQWFSRLILSSGKLCGIMLSGTSNLIPSYDLYSSVNKRFPFHGRYECHSSCRKVLFSNQTLFVRGSKLLILGMVIPPLIGNPYNACINPYYKVDDHPLTNGNNGSLDSEIVQQIRRLTLPYPLVGV